MMNQVYMHSGRRKPRNSDYIRTYAPYVATAMIALVLFWGIDSIKQDTQHRQYEPVELVRAPPAPSKDWTHKLSTVATPDDKTRPDDENAVECPLPSGNWGHTCDREIRVEGPCRGKCLLLARCQDMKEKFKETTFEYSEGRQLEIKNVNGLLCAMEDGSPSCGLNFHGNLALKNCPGYIPRRHEILIDGLYADLAEPPRREPPHPEDWLDGRNEADEYDEARTRRKDRAADLDPDYDARGQKLRRHMDNGEEGYDPDTGRLRRRGAARDDHPRRYMDEAQEEARPAPKRALPKYEEEAEAAEAVEDDQDLEREDFVRYRRPRGGDAEEEEDRPYPRGQAQAPARRRFEDDDRRAHRSRRYE